MAALPRPYVLEDSCWTLYPCATHNVPDALAKPTVQIQSLRRRSLCRGKFQSQASQPDILFPHLTSQGSFKDIDDS